jgi:hypothetical protein
MAKKRGRPTKQEPAPGNDRIELAAPAGWAAQVDAIAALVGLSRSAYIRQAVMERMITDRVRLGLKPPSGGGGEA